jgi:hypothetical protein
VAVDLGAADITSLIAIPGGVPAASIGSSPDGPMIGNTDSAYEVPSVVALLRRPPERGKSLLLASDALSGDLLVSADGGGSWLRAPILPGGSRIWTLWADRSPGIRLFAGTGSDGIYALDFSNPIQSAVAPGTPR